VGGQLGEVLRRHGITRGRRETRLRAEELLRQVGVPDPARVYRSLPHELSGGLRQRVVIAMGIACSPKLLIADEPTTALDVTVQAQVLELFSTLRDELGMGLLMVTHDVGVAREIADRVAVMYAGSLVEEGPSDDVVRAPLHPYTAGLLNALPRPDVPRGQLVAIPGRPPAAGEIPAVGCAFAARCDFAIDSCRTETPPLLQIGDRATACPVVDAHRALGVALQPGAHQPGGRLVAPEWLVPQQHAPLHDAASAPTPDTAPTGDNE
jgi:oligopeptide/dipeptide ABC transporter ATP-binding protein